MSTQLSDNNTIAKNINFRNVELDMLKIILVVGMIAAHVFQLLYNGDMFSRVVGKFSLFINAITFSGFLFAFGCATQLAYLRKPRNKKLMKKLMKNGLRLLVAFYISGFAYTLLVSHSLTILEAVKILCLWRIPGFSEFLLSFAMLMPLVWFLYRPLNVICSRWTKWGG